jgi:hypothetical protein
LTPKAQNCRHCENFVDHFHEENGIPGSYAQAEIDREKLIDEESPVVEGLKDELSAKTSEAERLRTELNAALNVAQTGLDAKQQEIDRLLEENRRLKASHKKDGLDRLRRQLQDQQRRREVLSERNMELQELLISCRRDLVETHSQLRGALTELESARQYPAQLPPPLPHPIEDASIWSTAAMSRGHSQSLLHLIELLRWLGDGGFFGTFSSTSIDTVVVRTDVL